MILVTQQVELVKIIGAKLRIDFVDAEIIDDERAGDGVRLNLPSAMLVLRYSQNGPYLTIKFEAKDMAQYDSLREYLKNLLHQYNKINWQSDININIEALE